MSIALGGWLEGIRMIFWDVGFPVGVDSHSSLGEISAGYSTFPPVSWTDLLGFGSGASFVLLGGSDLSG